jgi:hypothetical protein
MTIRPDYITHQLPVTEWTEEEGFGHLRKTFDFACRDFPDAMEPYAVQITDIDDRQELKSFMRKALGETFGPQVNRSGLRLPTIPTISSALARSRPAGRAIPISLMNVILQLRTGLLEKRDSSHWGVINVRDEEQGIQNVADLAGGIDGAVTHRFPSRFDSTGVRCFRNMSACARGRAFARGLGNHSFAIAARPASVISYSTEPVGRARVST